MDWRGLLPSRSAWRRWTAAGALVTVAVCSWAVVAADHSHGSGRILDQGWWRTEREASRPVHPGWRPHRGPVPILMYHVIQPPRAAVMNPLLYVSGRTFSRQMRWLDRHGFEGVTLDQVEDAWTKGAPLPRRPIVISFDDGYRSHYTTALPILRRHGWPGVLSLAIGNMRLHGGPITAGQVQKLVDAGWELASHTISHLDLRFLSGRRLRHELRDSRRIILYVFRVPADNFTYPAGLYTPRVIAAVRKAGYRGALTVAPGLANRSKPFELKRIRIIDSMGVRGLASELKALGL